MKEGIKDKAVLKFKPDNSSVLHEPSIREKRLLEELHSHLSYSHKPLTQKELMAKTHLTKRELAASIKNLHNKKILSKPARRYAHIRITDQSVVPMVEHPVFLFSPEKKRLIRIDAVNRTTKQESVENHCRGELYVRPKLA